MSRVSSNSVDWNPALARWDDPFLRGLGGMGYGLGVLLDWLRLNPAAQESTAILMLVFGAVFLRLTGAHQVQTG